MSAGEFMLSICSGPVLSHSNLMLTLPQVRKVGISSYFVRGKLRLRRYPSEVTQLDG